MRFDQINNPDAYLDSDGFLPNGGAIRRGCLIVWMVLTSLFFLWVLSAWRFLHFLIPYCMIPGLLVASGAGLYGIWKRKRWGLKLAGILAFLPLAFYIFVGYPTLSGVLIMFIPLAVVIVLAAGSLHYFQ